MLCGFKAHQTSHLTFMLVEKTKSELKISQHKTGASYKILLSLKFSINVATAAVTKQKHP